MTAHAPPQSILVAASVLAVLAVSWPGQAAQAKDKACVDCHLKLKDADAHKEIAGDSCLFCHSKHKKDDSVDTKGCTDEGCHTNQSAALRRDVQAHSPYKFKWCKMCHEHQSGFLKPPPDTEMKLCLKCHDKHLISDQATGQKVNVLSTHPPKGKGEINCSFCHPPHVAPQAFEVTLESGKKKKIKNPSRLNKPEREVCKSCHKQGSHHIAPNNKQIEAKSEKARRIGCTVCHNAHLSIYPHLLKSNRSKAELCAECHGG